MSCDKEETDNLSRITTYPIIAVKGEQFTSIPVGGTFKDEGVSATVGGAEIESVKSGDAVDVNTPGVYIITYTATNPDGFSVSANRYVGVIAPDAEALDLTGNYKRNAGALGVSKVTKLGPGHYTSDNIGGVAVGGPATTVHFFHTTGKTLIVPEQENAGGTFAAINASYNFGDPAATPPVPASYTWTVINAGYGAAPRTFVKQ
ncbi:DUF5011 domain-containing protein [Adhaeribacter soli]|uniref:DUF5011 domain-containing protein n=2 Tax=Adhaeribacter soli TaxID=2607655 RepID=A0A5N1J2Q6_9BACT|nr:DUF5011 domain-containing protein [Adhaeribacter soli]